MPFGGVAVKNGLDRKIELVRERQRKRKRWIRERLSRGVRKDSDDGGRWITTENNHKVHLNEEGVPDKGNPHVIEKMVAGGAGKTVPVKDIGGLPKGSVIRVESGWHKGNWVATGEEWNGSSVFQELRMKDGKYVAGVTSVGANSLINSFGAGGSDDVELSGGMEMPGIKEIISGIDAKAEEKRRKQEEARMLSERARKKEEARKKYQTPQEVFSNPLYGEMGSIKVVDGETYVVNGAMELQKVGEGDLDENGRPKKPGYDEGFVKKLSGRGRVVNAGLESQGVIGTEKDRDAFEAMVPEEADETFRGKTAGIWKKLTKAARYALYDYTGNNGYKRVNGALRGMRKDIPEDTKKDINLITDAVDKSSLGTDTILYRGTTKSAFCKLFGLPESFFDGVDVGDAVGRTGRDDAFMSCGAAEGAGYSGQTRDVVLRVFTPKGTKALYAEPFAAGGGGHVGPLWDGESKQVFVSGECEVIVQRGTTLKITGVKKKRVRRNSESTWEHTYEDVLYVDVCVVGQEYEYLK